MMTFTTQLASQTVPNSLRTESFAHTLNGHWEDTMVQCKGTHSHSCGPLETIRRRCASRMVASRRYTWSQKVFTKDWDGGALNWGGSKVLSCHWLQCCWGFICRHFILHDQLSQVSTASSAVILHCTLRHRLANLSKENAALRDTTMQASSAACVVG